MYNKKVKMVRATYYIFKTEDNKTRLFNQYVSIRDIYNDLSMYGLRQVDVNDLIEGRYTRRNKDWDVFIVDQCKKAKKERAQKYILYDRETNEEIGRFRTQAEIAKQIGG